MFLYSVFGREVTFGLLPHPTKIVNDKRNNTKILVEKLGFVKISEYSNWYDSSSGSWRQSLYIFKPKYRTLENK